MGTKQIVPDLDAQRDPAHRGRYPTHGMDIETKPALLDDKYQERVAPEMSLVEMSDKVVVLTDLARMVFDEIKESKNAANMQAGAEFQGLLNFANIFAGELQSGKLRPKDYGEMDSAVVLGMKQRWAAIVSGGLTQLNSGREWMDVMGIFNPETGVVYPWVLTGVKRLVGTTLHTMKDWARLLAWEDANSTGTEDPADIYSRVIKGRARGTGNAS